MKLKSYPEDVTEVEVKPDASWRPKLDCEQWRLPDGSLPISSGDVTTKPHISKQVKEEDQLSEGHVPLKIGMKRNRDGHWELNGAKDKQTCSNSFDKNVKKKVTKFAQCTSATASNGDHEDPSVNQQASENLDILLDNDPDFDSASLEFARPSFSVFHHASSQLANSQLHQESEVIVLSDSEEEIEDEPNIGSSTASAFAGSDNIPQGGFDRLNSSDNFPEEALVSRNSIPFVPSSSCTLNSIRYTSNDPLDFIGVDAFEFNTPFQSYPLDTGAPDSSPNSQHASVLRPTSVTRYTVAPHQQINDSSVLSFPDYVRSSDSPTNYLNTDVNGNPVENLSTIDNSDASLQLFLSPQPARPSFQDDTSEPVITSDTLQANWISLSLGSGNIAGTHTQQVCVAECDRQHTTDERSGLDSLANTGTEDSSFWHFCSP